jgi:hypothetical protein
MSGFEIYRQSRIKEITKSLNPKIRNTQLDGYRKIQIQKKAPFRVVIENGLAR